MKTSQRAVGATAVALLYPSTTWRRVMACQVSGGTVIYIGFDASVGSGTGMALPSNLGWVTLDIEPGASLYAISTAGGTVISTILIDKPSPFERG
jgi:hypothetical protein